MFVFSNLATSLDGKIATQSRAAFYLGTPADRKQMQVLRKKCDVLLMGAGTLRTYGKFCGVKEATDKRQPANAIISRSMQGISPTLDFFSNPHLTRLLFLTDTARMPAALKRVFEKTSEIIPISGARPPASQIIKALTKRGYSDLLVEGGGGVMWDFAQENLIDEYHVTLTPKIVGGAGSPTLVDGKGFLPDNILKLRLKKCRRLGDELYLTYSAT